MGFATAACFCGPSISQRPLALVYKCGDLKESLRLQPVYRFWDVGSGILKPSAHASQRQNRLQRIKLDRIGDEIICRDPIDRMWSEDFGRKVSKIIDHDHQGRRRNCRRQNMVFVRIPQVEFVLERFLPRHKRFWECHFSRRNRSYEPVFCVHPCEITQSIRAHRVAPLLVGEAAIPTSPSGPCIPWASVNRVS